MFHGDYHFLWCDVAVNRAKPLLILFMALCLAGAITTLYAFYVHVFIGFLSAVALMLVVTATWKQIKWRIDRKVIEVLQSLGR